MYMKTEIENALPTIFIFLYDSPFKRVHTPNYSNKTVEKKQNNAQCHIYLWWKKY